MRKLKKNKKIESDRLKATAPSQKISSYTRGDVLKWKFPSDLDVNSETAFDKIPEWLQNFKVNWQTIGFQKSVSDLPPIKGSALVIDKSMASTKYFLQLPEIKKYKGAIICCDRAIYTIIKQRMPEYVCNLDSSPLCMSFFDRPDVKKCMDKITAVFAVTTNPLTIRLWHGSRAFFTPYMGSGGITRAIMEKSGTPYLFTGGQVASFAYVLAYNLGANPIGIFGVTNGYDNKLETEYPGVPHRRIDGPYGPVWQDPVYEWYNNQFLIYIKHVALRKKVTTVNTTKAGALYSKYVTDLSLKEFVKAYE